MNKPNPRCLKRAFLAAIARLFGVALGAGAGSLLYGLVGKSISGWPIAFGLAASSFVLLWYIEYEREKY